MKLRDDICTLLPKFTEDDVTHIDMITFFLRLYSTHHEKLTCTSIAFFVEDAEIDIVQSLLRTLESIFDYFIVRLQ